MRLFVAFDLSGDTKDALSQIGIESKKQNLSGIRWVRREQLHFTLKFLGDVAKEQLPLVMEVVEKTAAALRQFDLVFDRLGCFPPSGPVSILWVGAQHLPHHTRQVVERLEEEFALRGFSRERRAFSPHITLARVKDASHGRIRAVWESIKLLPQRELVTNITLFCSHLESAGSRYEVLLRRELSQEVASNA